MGVLDVPSQCSGFANSLPLKDLVKRDLKELRGLALQLKYISQQTRLLAREAKSWIANDFSPALHRDSITVVDDGVRFSAPLSPDRIIGVEN